MYLRPILTLNPSRLRAARYRRQAMSALRANSSLSVRLKRYNQAMEKARAIESKTASACRFEQGATPRSETIRKMILLVLNNARPIGAYENIVLNIIQVEYPLATTLEVRCELERLSSNQLVELDKTQRGQWHVGLTDYGVTETGMCATLAMKLQGGVQ